MVGIYKRKLAARVYTCTDPALSLLGTIQPQVLSEELIKDRNISSGLVNRLILVVGEGMPEPWPLIEDSYKLSGEIDRRLNRVLAMSAGVVMDGEHLKAPASLWRGQEMAVFGEYGPAVATRASTHALKLAALFECAEHWPLTGTRVQERWLDVALRLLERWFKKSAQLIAEVHLKTPSELTRRAILTFLQGCPDGATEGEISKALHQGLKTIREHLETLKARGSVHLLYEGKSDPDGMMGPDVFGVVK